MWCESYRTSCPVPVSRGGLGSPPLPQPCTLRHQMQVIRQQAKRNRASRGLAVDSITNVQGREFSVLIISTLSKFAAEMESKSDDSRTGRTRPVPTLLNNPRLFNTVVTRAQRLVVAVGNAADLKQDQHWSRFLSMAHTAKKITSSKPRPQPQAQPPASTRSQPARAQLQPQPPARRDTRIKPGPSALGGQRVPSQRRAVGSPASSDGGAAPQRAAVGTHLHQTTAPGPAGSPQQQQQQQQQQQHHRFLFGPAGTTPTPASPPQQPQPPKVPVSGAPASPAQRPSASSGNPSGNPEQQQRLGAATAAAPASDAVTPPQQRRMEPAAAPPGLGSVVAPTNRWDAASRAPARPAVAASAMSPQQQQQPLPGGDGGAGDAARARTVGPSRLDPRAAPVGAPSSGPQSGYSMYAANPTPPGPGRAINPPGPITRSQSTPVSGPPPGVAAAAATGSQPAAPLRNLPFKAADAMFALRFEGDGIVRGLYTHGQVQAVLSNLWVQADKWSVSRVSPLGLIFSQFVALRQCVTYTGQFVFPHSAPDERSILPRSGPLW